MLVAVFLAIVLHAGLVYFKIAEKPTHVPGVSFPRSVSVFLNQKSLVETPLQQTEEAHTAENSQEDLPAAEIISEQSVTENSPNIVEKVEVPVLQPILKEQKVKKPAAEEIVTAAQKMNDIADNVKPESNKAAKVKEPVIKSEHQEAQHNDGGSMKGTIQTAYPRYQLNAPPPYPGLARKRGQDGTVIIQVLVNEEGRVDDLKIEISSNFRLLDRAAVSAVRKWSFEPGRRGNERIPMWIRVPVTFKLK
jgi:protein TonB